MGPYGDNSLVNKILAKVKEEGGHIELTEEFLFKKTKVQITNIYSNGSVKYKRIDDNLVQNKDSDLNALNDKVLNNILIAIEKDKFI